MLDLLAEYCRLPYRFVVSNTGRFQFRPQYRHVICDIELGEEHHTALRLQRNDAVVHHLSYVRVEEDIRRKMATFSHAGEEQVCSGAGLIMQ